MTRASYGISLGMIMLAGAVAWGQAPAPGAQPAFPPITNLQVWPKDTSPAVIMQFMNAFDNSLGVQCNYCHVNKDGKLDFASDEKREKRVARQMILLRDSINVAMPAIVGKPVGAGPTSGEGRPGAPTRVLCASCHHGLPVPAPLADSITDAESRGGGPAGLARFRELRAKFYGGQQYDFTESALVGIANRSLTAKRPDDALAYLQANLEYFPKSASTYVAMAQAKNAKGDTAGATRDLEKAVELDPANAQARNQLLQTRGR